MLGLGAARSQPDNYSSNFTGEKAAGAELIPAAQYTGPPENRPQAHSPPTHQHAGSPQHEAPK